MIVGLIAGLFVTVMGVNTYIGWWNSSNPAFAAVVGSLLIYSGIGLGIASVWIRKQTKNADEQAAARWAGRFLPTSIPTPPPPIVRVIILTAGHLWPVLVLTALMGVTPWWYVPVAIVVGAAFWAPSLSPWVFDAFRKAIKQRDEGDNAAC